MAVICQDFYGLIIAKSMGCACTFDTMNRKRKITDYAYPLRIKMNVRNKNTINNFPLWRKDIPVYSRKIFSLIAGQVIIFPTAK